MAAQTLRWRDIALLVPEFVQRAVQKHGPLPEEVDKDTYDRYAAEYQAQRH